MKLMWHIFQKSRPLNPKKVLPPYKVIIILVGKTIPSITHFSRKKIINEKLYFLFLEIEENRINRKKS